MKTNPDELAHSEIKTQLSWDSDAEKSFSETYSVGGLTKREYFAAMAMQVLIPKYFGEVEELTNVSMAAVDFANALIEELNKEQK